MSLKQNILDLYEEQIKQNGVANISSIASRVGANPSTVRKYLKKEHEHLKILGRGKQKVLNRPPITEAHRRIGVKVTAWRLDSNSKTMTEAGKALDMTGHRINAIETGVYDMRLSELVRICKAMGRTSIQLELGN